MNVKRATAASTFNMLLKFETKSQRRKRSRVLFGIIVIVVMDTTTPCHSFSPVAMRWHRRAIGTRLCDLPRREQPKQPNRIEEALSGTASKLAQTGSNVKSLAGAATSGISWLAEKGSSDVEAVAMGAQERSQQVFQSVANTGSNVGSGVKSISGAATSRVAMLAQKGTSDIQNVAMSATKRVFAAKGRSTDALQSVTDVATTRLAQFATKSTGGLQSAATTASTGLTSLTERGRSDATNAIQWTNAQAKGTATAANTQARTLILGFTGKNDYQFGDVSKEVLRRISSTDYNIQDIMLLLRVMLVLGASFGPLAKLLPITALLEAMNVSLEARIGGKILEVLAESLDKRFVAAFTADELGDMAKRSVLLAIGNFTGKTTYKEGDIQRAVKEEEARATAVEPSSEKNHPTDPIVSTNTLELTVGPEFEEWDQLFRESHPDVELALNKSLGVITAENLDAEIACELAEWDQMFSEKYPDVQF